MWQCLHLQEAAGAFPGGGPVADVVMSELLIEVNGYRLVTHDILFRHGG